MEMGSIVICASRRELVERVAQAIAESLERRAAATTGRLSWALAGGSTPGPVYLRLTEPDLRGRIPWPRLDIFFGDERAVPPDDPESIYRLAAETLFARAPLAGSQIFRMPAEAADLDAAAAAYAERLPDRLDLLLLGMGPDGHTASLFPGRVAAVTHDRRVVVERDAPKPPPVRLTITPPVIAAAAEVVVMAAGGDKADALLRAREGPFAPRLTPIQWARHGRFFVDQPAAALLNL